MNDFSYKKRHTYGTNIVDEATHRPVAILDGRDGQTLKTWLKSNQHVQSITRDRASAYAKAIEEELPASIPIEIDSKDAEIKNKDKKNPLYCG